MLPSASLVPPAELLPAPLVPEAAPVPLPVPPQVPPQAPVLVLLAPLVPAVALVPPQAPPQELVLLELLVVGLLVRTAMVLAVVVVVPRGSAPAPISAPVVCPASWVSTPMASMSWPPSASSPTFGSRSCA